MKKLVVIFLASLLVSCSAEKPQNQYDSMVILNDKQFKVGILVADLATSIVNLGPPSSRIVDIKACGENINPRTIIEVADALKAAQFPRVGFVMDTDRDKELQLLCANHSVKGTAE